MRKKAARKKGVSSKRSQKKVQNPRRLRSKKSLLLRKASPFPKPSPGVFPQEAWSKVQSQPERVSPQEARLLKDLPYSYGETKLVLLVRDPYWAFSYWDFSGETWNGVQQKLAQDSSLKPVIRVHDLDAKRTSNLLISLEAKNWYLHLGTPDHRYVAELGIGDGDRRFYLIARSNEVRTPRDSPSEVVDSEWSDLDFEEIYRLSGGGKPGLSSPGSLFLPRGA